MPTATVDPNRMPSPAITSSAVTPEGSLWYAFDEFDAFGGSPPYSQNMGLYRLEDGQVTHFDIPATIRVLEVAPDGILYVGAGCGVLRYREGTWETLLDLDCGHRTAVTKLFPLDIAFTDGDVWVGGAHSLARYDGKTWEEYEIPALRIAVARDGTVWASGWDGRANSDCCLTHLSGDEWITYTWTANVPAEPEVLRSLLDQNAGESAALAPEASPTRSMKGYELYSWQMQGQWTFALVVGTNRIKTYDEISAPEVHVQGLEALKRELDKLPRGEQVLWTAHRVPNTALPPDEIVDDIQAHCRQRGIQLEIEQGAGGILTTE